MSGPGRSKKNKKPSNGAGSSQQPPTENEEEPTSPRPAQGNDFQNRSKYKKANYKWTSTVEEVKDGETQSWSVQFAMPPTAYHLRGPGVCWKQRELELESWRRNGANGVHPPISDAELNSLDIPVTPRSVGTAFDCLFATTNKNSIRIYRTGLKKKPRLVQEYEDSDPNEEFYCCAWVHNANKKRQWWLVAGGKNAVIRVIDLGSNSLVDSLTGHGDAIYDIKVHPRDPSLIVSASKDRSLQMWNLRTLGKIAMFTGHKGHRDAVLSVDFDMCGHRMVSTGIDCYVRIWEISENDDVLKAILESHKAADRGIIKRYMYKDEKGNLQRLRIPTIQTPVLAINNVHKHYIDCAMFVGDLILSKSVDNRLYLWSPGGDPESLGKANKNWEFTLLEEYPVAGCDRWFIRFGLNRHRNMVACAGEEGVHFYRLDELPAKADCIAHAPKNSPKSPLSKQTDELDPTEVKAEYVRQCAFSEDDAILITVDDQARVNQFERVKETPIIIID